MTLPLNPRDRVFTDTPYPRIQKQDLHFDSTKRLESVFSRQADLAPLLHVPTVVPDAQGLEPLDPDDDVLENRQRQPGVDDPGLDADLAAGQAHIVVPLRRPLALGLEAAGQRLKHDEQRGQDGVDKDEHELARQRGHDAVVAVAVREHGAAAHRDRDGERQAVGEALQVRVDGGGGDGEGVPAHGRPGRGEGGGDLVCGGEGVSNVGVRVEQRGHAEEDQDRAHDLRKEQAGG